MRSAPLLVRADRGGFFDSANSRALVYYVIAVVKAADVSTSLAGLLSLSLLLESRKKGQPHTGRGACQIFVDRPSRKVLSKRTEKGREEKERKQLFDKESSDPLSRDL